MRRYLVVANQTLGGDHLLQLLRDCVGEEECFFHVLVPASNDPHAWSHSLEGDRELARARLHEALGRFRRLGATVDGEVGDPRPDDAVLDVLSREAFDEIIVSTLPAGVSRWLRLDVVSRIRRAAPIPVRHVMAAVEKQPV